MKTRLIAIGAGLALCAGLGACASYGPHGPPAGYYDAAGYNAYYDDAYGPFYDGYWDGGDFYYSRAKDQPFQRDAGQHFQRTASNGFHGVHGAFHAPTHAAPAAEHRPG